MSYLAVGLLLLFSEIAYFKVAGRFKILGTPNLRSSHSHATIQGGGIIFPISVIIFLAWNQGQYPWFAAGMVLVALISFADDVHDLSQRLRLLIHFASVSLMFYQAGIFGLSPLLIAVAYFFIIGAINAFNFMDGINGITAAYSTVSLVSLAITNDRLHFVQPDLIWILLIATLVFAFFNFRKYARCFAGDVGSVSIAFALLFITLLLIMRSGNPLYMMFYAVYGIDTSFTLIHRAIKRENIFEAHRQHLFQRLANEARWPHLRVSTLFSLIQLGVNLVVMYGALYWELPMQWLVAMILLSVLGAVHLLAKFRWIRVL